MARKAEDVVKSILTVASLPTLYQQVDQAINEQAPMEKLVSLISEDTSMSARLLKLVNSAMFNFPRHIDTVSQAITIVGMQQLRALILASSVMNLFRDIPEDLITMEAFWRHSVACGVTARIIAKLRREVNTEYFFLCGLLHDIGRLIMFKEMPDLMSKAMLDAREQDELLFKKERDVIGYDHAKLGGMLLKEWKLPNVFVYATRYHHTPRVADDYIEAVATVHVADNIANIMSMGSSGESLAHPLDEKAWDSLGISEQLLPGIIAELQKQYKVAVEFILGSAADSQAAA